MSGLDEDVIVNEWSELKIVLVCNDSWKTKKKSYTNEPQLSANASDCL